MEKNNFKANLKERFRKIIVNLKRNPNHIALVVLIITCLFFNLRLTDHSDTIAVVNEPGMGICSFVVSLFSYLSIVSFLSAFPRRQKPKYGAIGLVLIMIVASIVCQILFYYFIIYGTEIKDNPIEITAKRLYINEAKTTCIVHIVLLVVSFVSIVTIPLYRKLLGKINTSKTIESTQITELELAEEE